jgi:bacillithiol biosynthesis cysteine-adding enzyme BshC
VDVRRFPWVRPLAGDYAFNFDNVAALYAGDPRSLEAWQATAARVQAHERNHRGIAECVVAQQTHRGAPPAAIEASRKLTDPATVAVVTGQQAGAFGGPLFTLLKAITALQLAQNAAARLSARTVAVFWVDAEDHDWEEVASCTALDQQFQPRTVTLPPPDGAGQLPVASLSLDDAVADSIDSLASSLTRTDFTEWMLDGVRTAYRPGIGMAEAFARWLESLLGPYGLIVFDSSDPAAKPLLADLFAREIGSPGHTAALAAKAGRALADRGHTPQVQPQPDSVSLFRVDGERKPIRRQGDRFVVGDTSYALAALAEEAAARPQSFSPNVLLRPVVQDTLFPTVCYVAGPSELAYLGQLRNVYSHFGVPMPLVHPRATVTLVDSATHRFLTKYNVRLEDLQPRDEAALNRLLQSQLPPTVDTALSDAEGIVHRAMERVIEAVPAVDPTLAGAAKTTLGKMQHELRGLQSKVIQAVKKRDETLRRQFARAQAQTFPNGHPQERVLGGVYFLNLYGPALIERLLQELPLDLGQHWVMTI